MHPELETSIKSLKTRLERSEQKVATAEQNVKRLTQERDSAAEQLGAAYLTQKDLESENDVLRNDNQLLRAQVKQLQSENRRFKREREELIAQLDHSHDRHEDETQQWFRREAELKLDAAKTDRALEAENQDLRDRLDEMRAQREEETRQFSQREGMAVRAAQKAMAERQQLEEEYKQLQQELADVKAQQEGERKRWTRHEKDLQARVQDHENTIHNLQVNTSQPDANKDLREQIAKLKQEIATLKADHGFDTLNGTARELELEQQLRHAEAEHEQESFRWKEKEAKLRARLHEIQEVNQKSRQLKELTARSGNASDASRARSRSKSVGRRETQFHSTSHGSAPVKTVNIDEISESESTTDLSLWHNKRGKSISKSKPATIPKVTDTATADITYLTPVSTEDVRAIRKKIEEEHLARRNRRTVSASEHPQNGAAIKAMNSDALPRKSSMKDLTGRSVASAATESVDDLDDDSLLSDSEDETGANAATKNTNLRATSRTDLHHRRRSSTAASQAFTEMTSAFILPDITLNHRRQSQPQTQDSRPILTESAKAVLSSLAPPHDPKTCTICQRLTAEPNDIKLPPLIPASLRPELQADPNATLRPTESPALALSRVSKSLHDELAHLQMRLVAVQQEMAALDPAVGKRKWDRVHARIAGLNEAVRLKAGQIYALFDVVEGQKGEVGAGEVEEVIGGLSSGVEADGVGKKVVLESFHDSEGRVYGLGGDGESEGEFPWEGITDTGSLRAGSVRGRE